MTRLADGGPYCADVQEAKHCLSLISLFLIAFYHVYDIVENLFFLTNSQLLGHRCPVDNLTLVYLFVFIDIFGYKYKGRYSFFTQGKDSPYEHPTYHHLKFN